MNQRARNDCALHVLMSHTPAFDLIHLGALLGANPDEIAMGFMDETLLDQEGANTLRSREDAAALAAAAVLREEPFAAAVGRLLYWSTFLYMTPDKVRRLVERVKTEVLDAA